MTLANSYAVTSPPQHCLKGEGGEMKTIFHCLQKSCYDLNTSLNTFCEGLLILKNNNGKRKVSE